MKKHCRTAAALLAIGLALAGCSEKTDAPPIETAGPAAQSETAAEPAESSAPEAEVTAAAPIITVRAVLQLNPEIELENNPVIAELESKLNIEFEIEAPPQDGYGDRVKMLVSTGDMPDLVHYGADISATQWAQEGFLLDLTDRIAQYPNLSANISQEQYGDCVFLPDGHIYGVPRPNSFDKWGFVINKKWLDAVGMKAPRTVDEFVNVCRAFTQNDPDGNGQNDTFGASLNAQQSSFDSGIWHLQNDFFSMAYSISGWHLGMPDADGGSKLRALKSKYPDYMKKLREMYEEGILDREFVTHNASENLEKIAQNRVGIVGASESNYTTNLLEKYSMKLDDFIYCPPLSLSESDKPIYAMPPSNWMAYYINAASAPEVQDAALRLLDWGNGEEGFVAMQMGIAGEHYNTYDTETRTVDRTDAQEVGVQFPDEVSALNSLEVPCPVTSHLPGPGKSYIGASGLYYDRDLVRFSLERTIKRMSELGVKYLGAWGGHFRCQTGYNRAKAIDEAISTINVAADCAGRYGMEIALEPQAEADTLFPRYLEGVEFAKATGRSNVKVMADLNYFLELGQPLEDILKYPDYCLNVHIQGDGGAQPNVGRRDATLTRLFEILREAGYDKGVSAACPWVSTNGASEIDYQYETDVTLAYLQELRAKVY